MQVGSLVECIESFNNDNRGIYKDIEKNPIVGNIYTVRNIVELNEKIGIQLEEIMNPILKYNDCIGETFFNIKKFREIQPPMEINIEELMEELV